MWGVERKDLVTVIISCNDSKKSDVEREHTKVEWKSRYPRIESLDSTVIDSLIRGNDLRNALLGKDMTTQDEAVNDVRDKLLPLTRAMEPLGHFVNGTPSITTRDSWDIDQDSKYLSLLYEILYIYTYTLPKKISWKKVINKKAPFPVDISDVQSVENCNQSIITIGSPQPTDYLLVLSVVISKNYII